MRGFTLLEVVIAMGVLLGALSLGAGLAVSLTASSQRALDRDRAVGIGEQVIARIRDMGFQAFADRIAASAEHETSIWFQASRDGGAVDAAEGSIEGEPGISGYFKATVTREPGIADRNDPAMAAVLVYRVTVSWPGGRVSLLGSVTR